MAPGLLQSPAVSCSVHNPVWCPKEPVICPGFRAGFVGPEPGLLQYRKGGFLGGRGWGPAWPWRSRRSPSSQHLGCFGGPGEAHPEPELCGLDPVGAAPRIPVLTPVKVGVSLWNCWAVGEAMCEGLWLCEGWGAPAHPQPPCQCPCVSGCPGLVAAHGKASATDLGCWVWRGLGMSLSPCTRPVTLCTPHGAERL